MCILLLPIALTLSCSRPGTFQDGESPQAGQPQVPLDGAVGDDSAKLTQNDSTASSHEMLAGQTSPPFRGPLNLPAGTLVTVRLAKPISASELGIKGPFDAVVDDAVVIEGVTIIPRGAEAGGMVESARASRLKRDRGYVRLTLASIAVAGRKLPVQTASLFAKGSPSDISGSGETVSTDVIYLDKGRRLTFRLAGPLTLASQRESLVH